MPTKVLQLILSMGEYLLSLFLQKKAQDDRDKLEDSPADWFNGHFGGMRKPEQPDDKTN